MVLIDPKKVKYLTDKQTMVIMDLVRSRVTELKLAEENPNIISLYESILVELDKP